MSNFISAKMILNRRTLLTSAVIAGAGLTTRKLVQGADTVPATHELLYSFPGDHEWWQSVNYDRSTSTQTHHKAKKIYRGGPDAGPIDFPKVSGVEKGYLLADDSMWDIDVPDSDSILAMLTYRNLPKFAVGSAGTSVGLQPLYLNDANLEVLLAGDNLDLKGGKCYFFVHSTGIFDDWNRHEGNYQSCRWYMSHSPLKVGDRKWESNKITLENRPSFWTRSWGGPLSPSLGLALGTAISFGFAFHGFPTKPYDKPTGKFMISELKFSWT